MSVNPNFLEPNLKMRTASYSEIEGRTENFVKPLCTYVRYDTLFGLQIRTALSYL